MYPPPQARTQFSLDCSFHRLDPTQIIDIVLNGTANVTLEAGKRMIKAKTGAWPGSELRAQMIMAKVIGSTTPLTLPFCVFIITVLDTQEGCSCR